MKNQIAIFLFFVSMFVMVSCSAKRELHEIKIQGSTFGSYYTVVYYDQQNRNLQEPIELIFKEIDSSLSTYNAKSLISEINTGDIGWYKLDEHLKTILNHAKEISENTQGAFDITVGPLVNAWGFGFKNKANIDSTLIDSLLQYVGNEYLVLKNDTFYKSFAQLTLDVNAIAPGYAADVVAAYLENSGIESYIVEIGGEVVAKGTKPDNSPWKVGIEKPATAKDSPQVLKAVFEIKNQAVATSGNYRNYYIKDGIKYAHTINPKTGYPVTHSLLSATVVAKDGLTADAYATAFMVMGYDKTIEFINKNNLIHVYLIYSSDEGALSTFMSPQLEKLIKETE